MVAGTVVYLDSSALVKLVIEEQESRALRDWMRPTMVLASSALARTEVVRAVRPAGQEAVSQARDLLRGLQLIALDQAVLDSAARIGADELRSLDAIHLATALALGDDLNEMVTYDRRMIAAARSLGLPVMSPTESSTPG